MSCPASYQSIMIVRHLFERVPSNKEPVPWFIADKQDKIWAETAEVCVCVCYDDSS